ncbi:hypothetical protein SAMN04488573_1011269 [Bacillus sp. 5mfcol3.1]|nr:hypothetical protein SAMN04488573_1011269 [Bacillus sp. 5mfcol3.1]SIQ40843.1 hypothetical protein SAMN05878494_1328 [Bacillus cereus]
MEIYYELAQGLLNVYLQGNRNDEFTWRKVGHLEYGFKYMRHYKGLMANPSKKDVLNNRPKLGLFDFKVKTESDRYNITHGNIFNELIQHSNLDNCIEIWRGKDPNFYSTSVEEYKALTTLALLMFEQEINWGDEIFQKYTIFPPSKGFRPRDMLMGFVHMAFVMRDNSKLLYWMDEKNQSTTWFGKGGYGNYPSHMKIFFEHYKSIPIEENLPVIFGEIRGYFCYHAELAPDNPNKIFTNLY